MKKLLTIIMLTTLLHAAKEKPIQIEVRTIGEQEHTKITLSYKPSSGNYWTYDISNKGFVEITEQSAALGQLLGADENITYTIEGRTKGDTYITFTQKAADGKILDKKIYHIYIDEP